MVIFFFVGLGWLIVSWLLWVYPFLRQRNAGPKRESVVMAPSARWGIALESVGYGLVWFYGGAIDTNYFRITASMIMAAASTALVWRAVRNLGRQWRIQAGLYEDHELVRTGPYRFVRHPIYASMFGMLLATGLLLTPWIRFLIAIVFFIAGNEIRIQAEDRLLEERFGETFIRYKKEVAAYVPYLR